MTRLDGRFLKPGSIPADRLDPSIPLGGGGVLPDGAVTPAKLAQALLRKFVAVTWSETQDVEPNVKLAPLQLKDYLDQPIPAAHVLRITCDDRARLNVGEHGQTLSGVDSADLIAQTDETGRLDLLVTCPVQTVITIAAGATQGSPLLDAAATSDVSFT